MRDSHSNSGGAVEIQSSGGGGVCVCEGRRRVLRIVSDLYVLPALA